MKLNQLVRLGFASSLVVALSAGAIEVLTNTSANAETTTRTSGVLVAQGQKVVAATGNFVKAEAPTTGSARIVTENGQRFLEIDSAFSTSNQGPDLHVLLETSAQPPMSYKKYGSYVNLGKLQKFSGAQRYPIPDSINLAQYKSAVIWCRMANATFGYAPLRTTGNARR